jgi:hypothetical protein
LTRVYRSGSQANFNTNFSGWIRQPEIKSVKRKLEKELPTAQIGGSPDTTVKAN